MSTVPNLDNSTFRSFQIPAKKEEKDKEKEPVREPHKSQVAPSGLAPRFFPGQTIDNDKIGALTTNYSVAPGPAWIEFTNPAALSAGVITGDVPIWGSGDLLAKLKLPLACVIIKPTVTPALLAAQTAEAQRRIEAKAKAQPVGAEGAQARATNGDDECELLRNAQLAGMGVETQARHVVDDGLREQYQAEISTEVDGIEAEQPRLLTPEEQRLTGMSPQGFPGLLPGLRRASALPNTLGVQGVIIDTSVCPAEIQVRLVGTGQVPANSRWLIFTVTGV